MFPNTASSLISFVLFGILTWDVDFLSHFVSSDLSIWVQSWEDEVPCNLKKVIIIFWLPDKETNKSLSNLGYSCTCKWMLSDLIW